MKKTSKAKSAQANTKNQKITAFFTKYQPLPIQSESKNLNNGPSHDEDVVDESPVKFSTVLEDVTNTGDHASLLIPERKRKKPDNYSEPIDLDVELPQRKKSCSTRDGVKVMSLADVTKEQFDDHQRQLKKKKNERQLKAEGLNMQSNKIPNGKLATITNGNVLTGVTKSLEIIEVSPEKQSTATNGSALVNLENKVLPNITKSVEIIEVTPEKQTTATTNESALVSLENIVLPSPIIEVTPEKHTHDLRRRSARPSPSRRGCTSEVSKKNPQKSTQKTKTSQAEPTQEKKRSPRKSTQKTPKKTPKKLFEREANASEFKVDLMESFVKVTPSKSQCAGVDTKTTPSKSAEKKQASILNYTSPSTSRRSSSAQSENERTPEHKATPRCHTPMSAKAKVKLDFTLSRTLVTITKPTKQSNSTPLSSHDNVNICIKTTTNDDEDLQDAFDDSWEENFQFTANYALDLTSSQHCKVLEVTKSGLNQTIVVQSTKSEEKAICTLSDFWAYVKLQKESTIHLMAVKNKSSEWVVSNTGGLLVYEPDFLISSTSVAGALFCKRKSILKDRYPGFYPGNKVMLVGTLVHELLQTCLRNGIQTNKEIVKIVDTLLKSRDIISQLFEISLTIDDVKAEIKGFVPQIITFMQQYLQTNAGKYPVRLNKEDWRGKIDTIQDIEENIWCPELGVKGKVDVSVRVGGSVLPLELKTGRASMSLEHRGQIILYINMMNKLGYKVPSGLLLYLREGVVREIPMNEREKRDLTILRNELAYYLTSRPKILEPTEEVSLSGSSCSNTQETPSTLISCQLPPPVNHHSACGKCEYNTLCCLYLKHDNTDLSEYKYLSAIRDDVLAHLETAHIQYFVHWSSLLALENSVTEGKHLREIYTKSVEHREKNGKCITHVKVLGDVSECNGLFSTTFQSVKETDELINFLLSGIGEQSYVVVSKDSRPAVAAGLVSNIEHKSITLELDRNLNERYLGTTFHLDTYDSNSINAFNFACLSILMEPTDRASTLRKLIVDRVKPTFRKSLPSEVGKKSVSILKRMNKMQQKAVIKALAANDYLLIKGMPGTGKTATIVAMVQFLVELNQTVLIMSHTHLAVDNVCIRLQECGVNVFRLGSESRIHPTLQKRSERFLTKDCLTPEDLEAVYNNANVFAVTCMGSKHPILSKRMFDACIIDESTQVLQCSVIRALNSSKKFILIGDPDQLPPIVKNREALARGLSESLFERLQSPESTVTLNLNYRMNKLITALANDLTYNGQLLIANGSIANANLRLPKIESFSAMYREKQWILQALDDDLDKSVYVVDTGPVWNKVYDVSWIQKTKIERKNDEVSLTCSNPSETAVVVVLVQALLKGGKLPSSIGVIAPFRAQVAQISLFLHDSGVDVSTVDQFQGQDKDVILYSCTKSRDTSKPRFVNKFEILEDKRRLTVAVTRAKHKLIVIADISTVREYAPFGRLFALVRAENSMKLIEGDLGFSWETLITECEGVRNT